MKNAYFIIVIILLSASVFGGAMMTDEELFFKAVREGDAEYVTEVLDAGTVTINVKDPQGMTALMIAVEMENIAMIKTLAPYKPSITTTDKKGRNAVTIAAGTLNTKVVAAVKDLE